MSAFAIGLVAALLLFPAQQALSANVPPRAPQLRIETGMHTDLVTQIAYDASRSRLVTISNDKTLRIWQLPSGRLVDTLRIPIGEGSEGQLYGLALSPNGRIAAVTGWTGWEWDGRACIYFFDLESNELIARLAGLPTMAGNLTFSPDGKRLIVPLSRGFGLRVYDTSDFSIVATDTDYEDSVIGWMSRRGDLGKLFIARRLLGATTSKRRDVTQPIRVGGEKHPADLPK
jgi:WD40 repeat protein